MSIGSTNRKLSEQLLTCVFTRILEATLSRCQISNLADAAGYPAELFKNGQNGLNPDTEAKAKILAHAFLRCKETEEILSEFLNEIREMLKLKTSKRSENLHQLTASVDFKSQLIIDFFLKNRYTGIRKLADLIEADSDMEVLMRVREVINPKAEEILGFPLLNFKRFKIDLLTGEKIFFSWWLADELKYFVEEEMLDVFYENDQIRVISCLPPHLHDVAVEVRYDFLILSGKDYHKEIPLLYSVRDDIEKTLNNGVLDVRLKILEAAE